MKNQKRDSIKIHAVDVDLTLTKETCWTIEEALAATPNQLNIDYYNSLYDARHFIIIYTARPWNMCEATIRWLNKVGVKWNAIMMEKMPADFYHDDKAVLPPSMKKVEKKESKLKK